MRVFIIFALIGLIVVLSAGCNRDFAQIKISRTEAAINFEGIVPTDPVWAGALHIKKPDQIWVNLDGELVNLGKWMRDVNETIHNR